MSPEPIYAQTYERRAISSEMHRRMELPERMRYTLRKVEMSQQEMALYLGVTRSAVSDWLNGHTEPKLGMLRAWADRCGVELEWLAEAHPGTHQALRLARATERFPEMAVMGEVWQDADGNIIDAPETTKAPSEEGASRAVRQQGLEPRTR